MEKVVEFTMIESTRIAERLQLWKPFKYGDNEERTAVITAIKHYPHGGCSEITVKAALTDEEIAELMGERQAVTMVSVKGPAGIDWLDMGGET